MCTSGQLLTPKQVFSEKDIWVSDGRPLFEDHFKENLP